MLEESMNTCYQWSTGRARIDVKLIVTVVCSFFPREHT